MTMVTRAAFGAALSVTVTVAAGRVHAALRFARVISAGIILASAEHDPKNYCKNKNQHCGDNKGPHQLFSFCLFFFQFSFF